MNISLDLSSETLYEKFFRETAKDTQIVLYGAGNNCLPTIEFLKKEKMTKILGICDRNENKWGTEILGVPVMSFENLRIKFPNAIIFVTTFMIAKQVILDLSPYYPREKIIYFTKYEQEELHGFRQYVRENLHRFQALSDSFADKKSQEVLQLVLEGRNSGDYRYYDQAYTENQYFQSDIYQMTEEEVFLDVGGFDGDTVRDFLRHQGNSYKKIITCEPNPENYKEIEKICVGNPKISLIKKGISDQQETLYLDSKNSASSFGASGDLLLELDSLDHLIDEEITFLKMDIEGFEIKALAGAVETIKKYKPTLAVCVYHKYTDFLEIPAFIRALGLGYEFYLRHHNNYGYNETVLYGVMNKNSV